MSGHHDDDHDHGHHHRTPEPPLSIRARALESLLVEKGLLTSEVVDRVVGLYERDIGPHNGARVVARAWVDSAYRARLIANGTEAIEELGFGGVDLRVVENTPDVHNMVVCTLCSCYPHGLIGLPPTWYKSFEYRSRAVIEPRAVLRDFGLELPERIEIRVWDSSSELRYMVLPMRPAGTEGMSEDQLAALVTRDAMIGTAIVAAPGTAAA
jgi:nitrile hydratase